MASLKIIGNVFDRLVQAARWCSVLMRSLHAVAVKSLVCCCVGAMLFAVLFPPNHSLNPARCNSGPAHVRWFYLMVADGSYDDVDFSRWWWSVVSFSSRGQAAGAVRVTT